MDAVIIVAISAIYAVIGARYFLRTLPVVPRLVNSGRRHSEASHARTNGAPEWAVSFALLVAAAAAVSAVVLMASLWPLVAAFDRFVDWK